jgi:drug/metabolite transporter (DMT)-like permease
VTMGPLFWFPLLAAILFALGAILLKRSAHWQIDLWRTTFISNISTAMAFAPLLVLGGKVTAWHDLWQPLAVGSLFVVGQVTTMLALTKGEVSVATPVLGLKIVLVALFSWLLIAKPLPANIWIASLLATLGVMLLNVTQRKTARGSVTLSVICALAAAAAFGLFDVCVQMWSPNWGIGIFLPLVFGFSAVLSLAFVPLFPARLSQIARPAWPWLAGGCLLIALQSLAIVCTVAHWGNAAAANVVYSTRGLWGVLLVWWIGPMLAVHDVSLTGRILWFRLLGATLLLIAILLLA